MSDFRYPARLSSRSIHSGQTLCHEMPDGDAHPVRACLDGARLAMGLLMTFGLAGRVRSCLRPLNAVLHDRWPDVLR